MSFLNRLAQTANQSKILHSLHDMLKIVIEVNLFYLVREDLFKKDILNITPKIDACNVVFLDPSDLKVIATNPEVPQTEDALLKRLSDGCICIGIKHRNEIAAYMWCNLRKCDFMFLRFDLHEDEAFLMDARTLNSYRGKNLAPYLRVELYKYLRQIGRTKFYSITMYWNVPAQRFKHKLNAKNQKIYLWIKLFNRYKKAIPLKSYKIN